jgi:hypothetical protein
LGLDVAAIRTRFETVCMWRAVHMALMARWAKNDHNSLVSIASAAETLVMNADVSSVLGNARAYINAR